MPLTPEDVVNKRFQPTKFREGYDQDEVDDFLDEVVSELRRLNEENQDLRGKLSACENRVGELSRSGSAGTVAAPPADQSEPELVAEPVAAEQETRGADPEPAAQPAAASADTGPEAAAGVLVLAQKLHDEYVRSGQEQRDEAVRSGEQQRDQIVGEAQVLAERLIREAEDKQRATLGSLEHERTVLERKIDELRGFEREFRSRMRSYLEGQLRDLDAKGPVVPERTTGGYGASSLGGGLPNRAGYAADGQQDGL